MPKSPWSQQQFEMHLEASRLLMSILVETFQSVGDAVRQGNRLTEYAAHQAMLEQFRRRGLITFSPPIVAVNQNSGNPHYEPSETSSAEIRRDDLLLVDLWGKLDKPESVYADYTWVALSAIIGERRNLDSAGPLARLLQGDLAVSSTYHRSIIR